MEPGRAIRGIRSRLHRWLLTQGRQDQQRFAIRQVYRQCGRRVVACWAALRITRAKHENPATVRFRFYRFTRSSAGKRKDNGKKTPDNANETPEEPSLDQSA